MKILSSPQAFKTWRNSLSPSNSVGFVPTMGALHEGHLTLVERSLKENKVTVASIFVNPLQFGPKEDLARYPRPFKKDTWLLRKMGIAAIFSPVPKTMYTPSFSTHVSVSNLTNTLCGSPKSRGPHHFIGVATVVNKLLNIVRPTRAYFGMKDFQQLRVIEQMVLDLNMNTAIVRCPTVREPDGLAKSSRNAYLSPHERRLAPLLYQALQLGRKTLRSTQPIGPRRVCQRLKTFLTANHPFRIDYIDVVDPVTLQPKKTNKGPALLAAAVFLGRTRLIDNVLIST